jgi:hypothetical protein
MIQRASAIGCCSKMVSSASRPRLIICKTRSRARSIWSQPSRALPHLVGWGPTHPSARRRIAWSAGLGTRPHPLDLDTFNPPASRHAIGQTPGYEAVQVAPPGRFLVESVLAISRFDFRPCVEKPRVQGVARGRSRDTSPCPASPYLGCRQEEAPVSVLLVELAAGSRLVRAA